MRIVPAPAPVAAIAALFLTAGGPGGPPLAEHALPWLRDVPAAAAADAPARGAEAWLRAWRSPDPACTTSADAGFALAAELHEAPGLETVMASYTAGVVVLDARGRRLASAPPFPCRGSADTLEGIVVIDGDVLAGEPAIAIAATAGGRAERTTSLLLLALRGAELTEIFAAPVEEWRGPEVSAGALTRLPRGALRYRAPDGAISEWTYDREAGRFVMRELLRRPGGAAIIPAV